MRARVQPRSATCQHASRCPGSSARAWATSGRLGCRLSEFDARLRLHARTEWVLHLLHLRYKVSRLDQLIFGVTASDDNVLARRAPLQACNDFSRIEVVVAQHDVKFVK